MYIAGKKTIITYLPVILLSISNAKFSTN